MSELFFSRGNTLLPSNDEYVVRIFNLPAISIRDMSGKIDKMHPNICKEAPEICKEICYAYKRQSGREKIVYNRRKENYDLSQSPDFVDLVKKKIEGTLKYYKNKNVKIIYRIHESGDYYNIDYLNKWVQIAKHYKANEKIIFMSYTKNIELLNSYLERERIRLDEINIIFKYSVMEMSNFKGVTYKKTSDYPKKVRIAEKLREEGLTYYTLYENESELPAESDEVKSCLLYKNEKNKESKNTCATCKMKCYTEKTDIVSVVR